MKKLFFTFLTLLLVYVTQAQQCNLLNVTWTSTPQSGNPYNVTFTRNNPTPTAPNYVHVYTFYVYGNSFSTGFPNTQISYNFPGPGTYNVAGLLDIYDSTATSYVHVCHDSVHMVVVVPPSPCYTSISSFGNPNGSMTFIATNLGGGTGMTYSWDFGDGSTATGSNVIHTYAASGTYTVTLVATGSGCTYTTTLSVPYFNGTLNCSSLSASFNASGTGYTRNFVNTSTQVSVPSAYVVKNAHWNFGDGSAVVNNNNYPQHTYAAAGTYTVTLVNDWTDSISNTIYCSDSTSQLITITTPPPAPNIISGLVWWDSVSTNVATASLKVWLIVHDSVANTLTAVDSTIVTGNYYQANYSFANAATGVYRTKAAILAGTPGATGLIPTYHSNSFYWNSATLINHTGGSSINKNIHMQQGIISSGPGFIGGNISLGANKGTNAGAPNILVMLRNTSGQLIRFTYTDANGDYSFGNFPAGNYNVYPESMNYITTPSTAINITSGQYTVVGVDFKKTTTEIKPITTGIQSIPESNLFSIYPNPSKGNLQINWRSSTSGSANIQITDMMGRTVLKTKANTAQSTNLDITQLQSGVYLVKVITDKAEHTEKIILQY